MKCMSVAFVTALELLNGNYFQQFESYHFILRSWKHPKEIENYLWWAVTIKFSHEAYLTKFGHLLHSYQVQFFTHTLVFSHVFFSILYSGESGDYDKKWSSQTNNNSEDSPLLTSFLI